MEHTNRPRSQATHTRRPVQYVRQATAAPPMVAEVAQPHQPSGQEPTTKEYSLDLRFQWPRFPRLRALYGRIFTSRRRHAIRRVAKSIYFRGTLIAIVLAILAGQLYPVVQGRLVDHSYDLGTAESLLQKKDDFLGKKLVYSSKDGNYNYNHDYSPTGQADTLNAGGPVIKATANADPSKGLTVTDPNNSIDFKTTPKFRMLAGKQDANRLMYPLGDGTGWMVYTMQAGGVKEDILLRHANGDTMNLEYTMDLDSQGLAARLLADGSVGIYGSSQPIMGNVTTTNEKDAALLQAARTKAKKDKLLFTLPTPVVYETGGTVSKSAKTHYELEGEKITTVTTGLKNATFPLTVDPAVTVTSTSSLFRDTTPESNVDFNATTGNISRGAVTGGVLPAWTTNGTSLATSRFAQGAAIYDDFVYVAGGIPQGSGTVPTASVEFAKISSSSSAIGSWSSTTSLPLGIAHFQLQAYNGYLYAIGGGTVSNVCDTVSNTIYYIRIQANGQLSSTWSTNPAGIPTAVCSLGATTYNGKLYVAGGQTTKQFNSGITTVAYASFNPDGSVGAFTTSAVSLPAAATGGDLRSYNGYLYFLGGVGGASNTVYYAAIASDGSIYGSSSANWKATTSFATARGNIGSSFTFAYDGFMYLAGGCNNFNGSFACALVLQDTQIAQINADGSLGTWSNDTDALLPSATIGESLVSWRGNVYSIAGCTASAAQVTCTTALATQQYAAIAAPGQVGPLNTTTAMPTALFGHGATVLNGYIYVAGGCIVNSCQGAANVTGNVSYATLAADGTVGAWTTDTTNRLNTTTGLAYFGFTSHNGYLYATGGFAATGASTSINSSTVYYIKPNANGTLPGAWSTAAGMSVGRYGNSAVVYRGFLFVMGGCTGNTGTSNVACTGWSSVVDRFTLNATTGAPGSATTVTAMPVATAFMGTAFYNGYVYLAGGQTGTGARTSAIYRAQITSSGGLASWSATSGTLKQAMELTSAYAMNGYLYVTGGYDGTTIYNTIESGKITLSTGNIASNLADATTTITARWGHATVFSNGYIYMLGGCTAGAAPAGCTARSTLDQSVEQYYARNKNTSPWTTSSNTYATNRVMSAAATSNGYMYVAGGCKTSFSVAAFSGGCSGNQENTVYYAALNPDGTIGTWANAAGYNLPAARSGGCLASAGGYLYYLGGQGTSNTAVSTVYYSQIGSNGLPGSWSTATKPLGDTGTGGQARLNLSCSVFNGYIYATGGLDDSGTPGVQNTVFHTPSLANGGNITANWTTSTAFTTAREHHTSLAAGGYLYILGGDDKTSALNDVQYIQLDPATGDTTGSWAYTTDLPQAISTAGAFAANGYVYIIGGRTAAGSCVATTQVASINSSGTLSAWNVSANNLASARFGMGSAFYNGYYYSLGGNDCTNIISTNIIQLGGMRSPAMKGSFSKYADLNGNGQPEKLVIYLTNAKLNTVDIEEWSMSYVSSREAANSWGTRTNVTPLVTENAYLVKAYDGSGVDQVVARWFSLFFTINMEQSFTFTDDSQPTVYQYGLHYAPPPSKRLMHGRDFRDQNQQGLDLKLGI